MRKVFLLVIFSAINLLCYTQISDSLLNQIDYSASKEELKKELPQLVEQMQTFSEFKIREVSFEITEEFRKQGNQIGVLLYSAYIARLFQNRHQYELAVENNIKAIQIAKSIGDENLESIFLGEIGVIYIKIGNHQLAEKYILESLEICYSLEDTARIVTNNINLGVVYGSSGLNKIDKALKIYKEALSFLNTSSNIKFKSVFYNNISDIYLENNKLDSAKLYIDSLEKTISMSKVKNLLPHLFLLKAKFFLLKKDYRLALPYFDSTIFLAHHRRDLNLLVNAKHGLSDYYSEVGKFKDAYTNYKEYIILRDSLQKEKAKEQITMLQAQFEADLKDEELKRLEKNITAKEGLWSKNKTLLFTICIFLLVLLLIMIYAYKQKFKNSKILNKLSEIDSLRQKAEMDKLHVEQQKKEAESELLKQKLEVENQLNLLEKQKLESELAAKQRELASNTLHIASKNEILLKLKSELESIKSQLPEKISINKLQLMISEVEANINIDKEWEQFKQHFDKVHPDFFKKLDALEPDLTREEQRLCAYLKIDISNKEIAQILNITSGAVDKRKYRLKKKLNIDNEEEFRHLIVHKL